MKPKENPLKTLATLLGMSIIASPLASQTNPNTDLFKSIQVCCESIRLSLNHVAEEKPPVLPTRVEYTYLAGQKCPSGRLYFEFQKVDANGNISPLSYPDLSQPVSLPTIPQRWTETYDMETRELSSIYRHNLFVSLPLRKNFRLSTGEKLQFRVRCGDNEWSQWVTYCESMMSSGYDDVFGGEPYRPFPSPSPRISSPPQTPAPPSGNLGNNSTPRVPGLKNNTDVVVGGGINITIGGGGTKRPGLPCSESAVSLSAPNLGDFPEVLTTRLDGDIRRVKFTFTPNQNVVRQHASDTCTRVMVKTANSPHFVRRGNILPSNATEFTLDFQPNELPAEVVIYHVRCISQSVTVGSVDEELDVLSHCSAARVVGSTDGCCFVEFGTGGLFWSGIFPRDGFPQNNSPYSAEYYFRSIFGAQMVKPFEQVTRNTPSGFGFGYVPTGRYSLIDKNKHPPAFEWTYHGQDITYVSIPPGVRLTLYENPYFGGAVLLDVVGPLLMTFDPKFSPTQMSESRLDCSKEYANSTFPNVYNANDFYRLHYQSSFWGGIYNYFPPSVRKFFHEIFPNHINTNIRNVRESSIATYLFTGNRSMVIARVNESCESFVLDNTLPCGSAVIPEVKPETLRRDCVKNTASFSWNCANYDRPECFIVNVTNRDVVPSFEATRRVVGCRIEDLPIRPGNNTVTITRLRSCNGNEPIDGATSTFVIECPLECNNSASANFVCEQRLLTWTADSTRNFAPCLRGCFMLQILNAANNTWTTADTISSQNFGANRQLRLPTLPAYTYRVIHKPICSEDDFSVLVDPRTVSCPCPPTGALMQLSCDRRQVTLVLQRANPLCNTGCYYIQQIFARGNRVQRVNISGPITADPNQIISRFFSLAPMPPNTPFTLVLRYSPTCQPNANDRILRQIRTTCFEPCDPPTAQLSADCENVSATVTVSNWPHCQVGCFALQWRMAGSEDTWQTLSQNPVNQLTGQPAGNSVRYNITSNPPAQNLRDKFILEYRVVYNRQGCDGFASEAQAISEVVTRDCRLHCPVPFVNLARLDCESLTVELSFNWYSGHERCLVGGCIRLQRVAVEHIARNLDGTENWDATIWENILEFTNLEELFSTTGLSRFYREKLTHDIRTREYVYRTTYLREGCQDSTNIPLIYLHHVSCPCPAVVSMEHDCTALTLTASLDYEPLLGCSQTCFVLQRKLENEDENSWRDVGNVSSNVTPLQIVDKDLEFNVKYNYRVVRRSVCDKEDGQTVVLTYSEEEFVNVECIKNCQPPTGEINADCQQNKVNARVTLEDHRLCRVGCIVLQRRERGPNDAQWNNIAFEEVGRSSNIELEADHPNDGVLYEYRLVHRLVSCQNSGGQRIVSLGGRITTREITCPCPPPSAIIAANCQNRQVSATIRFSAPNRCLVGCFVLQWRINGSNDAWQNAGTVDADQAARGIIAQLPQPANDNALDYRVVYRPAGCASAQNERQISLNLIRCLTECPQPSAIIAANCQNRQVSANITFSAHRRCLVGCFVLQWRINGSNDAWQNAGTVDADQAARGIIAPLPPPANDNALDYRVVYRPGGCAIAQNEREISLNLIRCLTECPQPSATIAANCETRQVSANITFSAHRRCLVGCFVLQWRINGSNDAWQNAGTVDADQAARGITAQLPPPANGNALDYRVVYRPGGCAIAQNEREISLNLIRCLTDCPPPSATIAANCETRQVSANITFSAHRRCLVGCFVLQWRINGSNDAWQNAGTVDADQAARGIIAPLPPPANDNALDYRVVYRPAGCASAQNEREISLNLIRCLTDCPPPNVTIDANCETRQVSANITFSADPRCLVGCFVLQWRIHGSNDAWQDAGTVNADQAARGIIAQLPQPANNNALDYRVVYRPGGCASAQNEREISLNLIRCLTDCPQPSAIIAANCQNRQVSANITFSADPRCLVGCFVLQWRIHGSNDAWQDAGTVNADQAARGIIAQLPPPANNNALDYRVVYRPGGCASAQNEREISLNLIRCLTDCPQPSAIIAANCQTRQVSANITFNADPRCLVGCFVLQWRINGGNVAWQDAGTVNANQAVGGITTITAQLPPPANNNALDYRVVYRPRGCNNDENQTEVSPNNITVNCSRPPQVGCIFEPVVTNDCIDPAGYASNPGDQWDISIRRPEGNCNGCIIIRYQEIRPYIQGWVEVRREPEARDFFGNESKQTIKTKIPEFGDQFRFEVIYRPGGCNVTQGEVTFTTYALPCGEVCCPVHFSGRQWGPITDVIRNPDGSIETTSQPFVLDESSDFVNNGLYKNAEAVGKALKNVISGDGTLDSIAVPPGVRLEVFEKDDFRNYSDPFNPSKGRPTMFVINGPMLIANHRQHTVGTYVPNGDGLKEIEFKDQLSAQLFPKTEPLRRQYHNQLDNVNKPAFDTLPIKRDLMYLFINSSNTPERSIQITVTNRELCPIAIKQLCNARPPRPVVHPPVTFVSGQPTCPTCPIGGSFQPSFRLDRSEFYFALDRGWHPRCEPYIYNPDADRCEIDRNKPKMCSRIIIVSVRANNNTISTEREPNNLVYDYRELPLEREAGETNRYIRIEEYYCNDPTTVIYYRDYPYLFGNQGG